MNTIKVNVREESTLNHVCPLLACFATSDPLGGMLRQRSHDFVHLAGQRPTSYYY